MVSLSQFTFLSLLAMMAFMLQGCGDEKTPDKPQEQKSGKETTPAKPQEQESCSLVADVVKFIRINGKQGWTIQDFEKAGAFISEDDYSRNAKKIPWDQVDKTGLAPSHDAMGIYFNIGGVKVLLQPSMCEGTSKSDVSGLAGFPCGSVQDALSFLNINGKQHRTLAEFLEVGAYVTTILDSNNDADKIPWDEVAKATFAPAQDEQGPPPNFYFVVPGSSNERLMSTQLSPGMCESAYGSKFVGIAGFDSLAQLDKEGNQHHAQQTPSYIRGHIAREINMES